MMSEKKKPGPWPLILLVLLAFGLSLGAWVVFYIVADKTPIEHVERD